MKKLLLRLGIALVSILVAIGLAELWVRAADPFGISYYRDIEEWKGHAIEFVGELPPDPEGRIFQHLPGVDLPLRTFRFCTDAIGLRSAEPGTPPPLRARDEALTVLCLGDSTALCWGVDHADTWEVHLEREGLAPDGRPLVVHNAGHNIYDTVQEADLLSVLGPALRPELVIVMFNANDLEATIDVYDRIMELAADPPTGLERQWVIARSNLQRWFYGLNGLRHYREQSRLFHEADSATRRPLEDSPYYPENWPRTEAAYERILALCTELGAALVVADNGDPRVPDLEEWCRRTGVTYVDTSWTPEEWMSDVRNSPADAHANPRGNRIRAKKILAGLRAAGLLAEADADPEFLREVAEDEARRAEAASPRGLFLAHCATCHGENGDGSGTNEELDRPPRDFSLGGFAFGDTPEALFKTVSEGLGGSNPMPAFAGTLSDDEIRRVVEHVRTLTPERAVSASASQPVIVGDEALIVRGYLPPMGGSTQPVWRGLAVGLPGGASVLLDAEDMRPLAMLTGAFLARTDWEGRGGTPLEPLGEAVHVEPAYGAPLFTLPQGGGPSSPLSIRPRAVESRGRTAVLEYELVDPSGMLWGAVKETLSAQATSLGSVLTREIAVVGAHELADLQHQLMSFEESAPWPLTGELAGGRMCGRQRADGTWLWVHVVPPAAGELERGPTGLAVTGRFAHHLDLAYTVRVAVLPDVERETLQTFARELFR